MSDVKRVQRYDPSGVGRMSANQFGDFVKAADYDALLASHEQAWKAANSECQDWAREYEKRRAAEAERDQLRAKLAAIRGRPSAELIEAVHELIGAANSVNRSRMHEVRGHDDDQPRYWQRKEWVDWLVENGEKARQALDALPPQQPDAVSVPRESEALTKDAERYRWLCEKFGVTKLPCAIERILEGDVYVADGKSGIDAAIDAAMQEVALSTRQAEEGE